MSMKDGFVITGVDDVQRILDDIAPKHSRNLLRATVHGVAGEAKKIAKRNAPKQTGNLRKAIKHKRKKSHPDNPQSIVYVTQGAGVKNDAYYWRFVEHGTGGNNPLPARPFMGPAANSIRAQLPKILTEQFAKKLESKLKREAKKRQKS